MNNYGTYNKKHPNNLYYYFKAKLRKMQSPVIDLTINELADQIISISHATHLWKELNITQFSNKSLSKLVLCGKTNALINTYFGNPDDPSVQNIGPQLLNRYAAADEYLVKLHAAISKAFEMNRSIIIEEKTKVKKVIDNRARQAQPLSQERIHNREKSVLNYINLLPEDVVCNIKEYLPPSIILRAISIPTYQIHEHFTPLKLKNIKGVYDHIRKNMPTAQQKIYILALNEIVQYDDIRILQAIQPGPSKKHIISRISDICYCYNLVLNIVSKVSSNHNSPTAQTIHKNCKELTLFLTNELTYIYKLMSFASKPQYNGRAKPKPRSKPIPKKTLHYLCKNPKIFLYNPYD